jgi:hypothetical protein
MDGCGGYTRREPDPCGQRSANGTKVWGPRLFADPAKAKANRAAVVVRIMTRYPETGQALGQALQAQHEHVLHCMAPARGQQ